MKFFVPAAADDAQAESVYQSIAQFNSAAVGTARIHSLSWKHKGEEMSCTVGSSLPSYYGTGAEPVLAILDCGTVYKVCTPNRGGVRGEPVLAGKNWESHAIFFTGET